MDEAYRAKLRHWLTSMLILHLFAVLWTAYVWIWRYLPLAPYNPDNPMLAAEYLLGQIENYVPLFILLFFWHVLDFWQGDRLTTKLYRCLSSYAWPLACLCIFGLMWLFAITPWLDDLGCPEVVNGPNTFMFDGCGSVTPWWKMLLTIVPFLTLILSTIAKLLMAIVERSKPDPSGAWFVETSP